MADERIVETSTQPHTTIIERRGGGGGIAIAIVLLLAVAIGAFYLFNQGKSESRKDAAVSEAASSVGDAADKAGAAIDKATK